MIFYLMSRIVPVPQALMYSSIAAASFIAFPSVGPMVAFPFFLLVWSALPRRCGAFDTALPIRGRDILAARALWTLVITTLPLDMWIVATLVGRAHGFSLVTVLQCVAVVMLAILLPYSIRPGEIDEPPYWLTFAYWVGLAVLSAAVIYLLPPAVALVALVIAVVVTARAVWIRLPDSLEIASRAAVVDKRAAFMMSGPATTGEFAPRPWRLILRSLFPLDEQSFLAFGIYAALFGYGVAGPAPFHMYMFVFLLVPIATARQGTRWLSAFPISNRARLWCVLIPGVLVSLGCFELGRAVSPVLFRDRAAMQTNAPIDARNPGSKTRVKYEFWQRASANAVPIISAPWGESSPADTLSILGVTHYNPYSTSVENSKRFADWQFQRATTAVYGRALTADLYERSKANGTLPPEVVTSARMQVLNAAAVLAAGLLIAFLGEIGRWYRIGAGRRRLAIIVRLAWLPILALFAINLVARRMDDAVGSIVESFLWHVSGILPSNLPATVVIVTLLVMAMYALLEWQFGKAELLARRKPLSG